MDMADIQKGNIKVDIVRNLEQLKKAFNLRRQSFVKERGIPENMEFDGNDFSCTHLLFFSYILKDLKDYWLTQGFQPDPNGQEVKEGNLSLLPVIYPFKKEKPSLKTMSLLSREGNIKSY